MGQHDHSYKMLFSHAELVRDLLEGFIQQEWVKHLDLNTLEKVSCSFIADDLREREDDIIWRVQYGKKWVYIYILIEFQSTVDRMMATRLMTYMVMLCGK